MKKYESYSAFSLGWSQQFPAHWNLLRLKRVLRERKENNSPVKTKDILSLTNTRGVIPYSQKGNIGNKSKEDIEDYHIAHPDDLVLNSMNVVIGSVGVSKYYGAISPVYYALYPRGDENIRYFGHIFSLPTFEETLKGLGNGILEIRRRIPMVKLNNVVLPVPPRAEQDQIVRFLDWKTSRINRLINAKREQIANLRILKGNKINYIMSHGMGIGGVPRHCRSKGSHNWTIAPLKYFVTSNNESLTDNTKADREIDYIDISSVGFGFLKKMPEHLIFSKAPLRARRLVKTGDTIISTVRTYLRSMMYIGEELNGYVVSTGFSVLRPKQNIYPRILNYALSSNYFIDEVCRNSLGVSYPAINDGKLMRIKIALPDSAEEQEILVKRLDQDFYKLDEKINVCESEIGFLRELKTSLISDVVTGQIDVRDVEIPEYEHVEEIAGPNSEDDEAELEDAGSEVE